MPLFSEHSPVVVTVAHIADLGDYGVRRVLSTTEHTLTVELTAKRRDRIRTIDLHNGTVASGEPSTLPVLTKTSSAHAGGRWVRAARTKQGGYLFDTHVEWQDMSDGPIHRAKIVGLEPTCVACPKDCDLVFVGARTNALLGRSAVICLRRGQALWAFETEGKAEDPISVCLGEPRILEAFPYRLVAPDDGRFLAVSFMETMYFLDRAGRLCSQVPTSDIRTAYGLRSDTNASPDKVIDTVTVPTDSDGPEIEISTEIAGPDYSRVVSALAVNRNGGFFLASVANLIAWITETGQISHVQAAPLGSSSTRGGSAQSKTCQ